MRAFCAHLLSPSLCPALFRVSFPCLPVNIASGWNLVIFPWAPKAVLSDFGEERLHRQLPLPTSQTKLCSVWPLWNCGSHAVERTGK